MTEINPYNDTRGVPMCHGTQCPQYERRLRSDGKPWARGGWYCKLHQELVQLRKKAKS